MSDDDMLPMPASWPPTVKVMIKAAWIEACDHLEEVPHAFLQMPRMTPEQIAEFGRQWKEAMNRPGFQPALLMVPDDAKPGLFERVRELVEAALAEEKAHA